MKNIYNNGHYTSWVQALEKPREPRRTLKDTFICSLYFFVLVRPPDGAVVASMKEQAAHIPAHALHSERFQPCFWRGRLTVTLTRQQRGEFSGCSRYTDFSKPHYKSNQFWQQHGLQAMPTPVAVGVCCGVWVCEQANDSLGTNS